MKRFFWSYYHTAFQYIWNEIVVRVPLDADIDQTKTVLYDIIERNDTIKETPKNMESQMENASPNVLEGSVVIF